MSETYIDPPGEKMRLGRRPLIYVAAPFRAPTPWQMELNAQLARVTAFQLQRMGAATYVPHDNVGKFYLEFDEETQMDVCFSVLRCCDAMFTTGNWEHSEGVMQEIEFMRGLGLPVFHDDSDLSRFIADWKERCK